jgi:hypothetical protein
MCFLLTEQWRAYKNLDSHRKKQKALPMFVLHNMHDLASTDWEVAVSWLLIGAIFFAMWSCEYLETNSLEDCRQTKILLRLRNIVFKAHDGRLLCADSKENLAAAKLVIITFEFQKNDRRSTQVHMFSTNDSVLNPVVAWAYTVKRVWSYSHASMDSKVCAFDSKQGRLPIKADHVRIWLRSVAELVGEDKLGFNKDELGLHSIRSGGAMAMFMSGISTIIIQRVGRWSSEAFLEYIRDQIESFTSGVSQKMIDVNHFHHLEVQPMPTSDDSALKIPQNESGLVQVPIVSFSKLALEGISDEDKAPELVNGGQGKSRLEGKLGGTFNKID